jgi:hypothetical protein
MADRLEVQCPCCSTTLVVDPSTGDVLSEERPRNPHDFDAALNQVREGSSRREKAFDKAFDRTRRLDDVLAKKFEEAKKKAAEDKSEKPRSPFDFD